MDAIPEIRPAVPLAVGPAFVHPTDFGPTANLALAHAVALSLKAHARLTLLHIRGEREAGPTRNGLAPVAELLVRWGKLAPQDRFADFQSSLGFSATCVDVPAQSVSAGVLGHFEHHRIELAVLTTHARSGLSYWFAGSVSRRALRQANAMILFVREGQRGVVDSRTGQITLARALIPVDASPAAAVAVRRACAFLDQLGVTVEKRLLHIGDAPPPNCPKDMPMTLAQGPVGEAILQTAARFGADLIVMPTAGKRGLLSAFRDSLSARILDDAGWPVLSVPAIEAD